ncbi:MAG: TetR/AcrR family transcriptional regulator [Saprospiraceae bacterium]|nr:TetR/AcrR family transcriptional regulator [Saprospiraceae bacterium]
MAHISNRQYELIETAGKLLSRSGVGGLTIKNLAREMGFAESAVYRHFDSKEAIVVAMLDYLAGNMDKRLSEAFSRTMNPIENLEAIFLSHLTFFTQNPHFVVAVFSSGLLEESQQINQGILKLMEVMKNHVTPLIMDGQKQGMITTDVPAEDLTHILMGSFRLHMFKWRVSRFQFDVSQSGKTMIANLLKIIQPCKNQIQV